MVTVFDPGTGLPIGAQVDPRAAKRPMRLAMEGRHVLVRPVDPMKDAEALYAASHGPGREALWLYLFNAPFADVQSFKVWLDAVARTDDPLAFSIVDKASGKAVGMASYMRIVPEHRVIEVGSIWFAPGLQKSAGATEAMYLMAKNVFEDLGYRRYEWKCNAHNAPSRRAAKRLGFRFEGIFRRHMIVKGRNRDTAWFAMLDEEWPARKAAFEAWLDPSNFDGHGRQKKSLSALNADLHAHDREEGSE